MKTIRFFLSVLVAAAAMLFVSCEKEDANSDDIQNTQAAQQAFFPTGYDRNNVAAWYVGVEIQRDGQKNVNAVFIFNDGSMIHTLYKAKSDGRVIREVDGFGSCRIINGDWDNGSVIVNIPDMNMEMNLTITNGSFTAMDVTFTRQPNASIPTPQDPSNDNGGNGGENGGENGSEFSFTFSLPEVVSGTGTTLTVASTIQLSQEEAEALMNSGVNFSTLVLGFVYTKVEFGNPSLEMAMQGSDQHRIAKSSDNMETLMANRGRMTATLVDLEPNTQYNVMPFVMLDNSISTGDFRTLNSSESGNGGGDNGGDVNFDDVEAYLPADYANKTIVAWYSLTDETMDRIKIEAVFLFSDNTFVATKNKVYNDGRPQEKGINAAGRYQIESGDYENGTASAVTSEGMTVDISISNGILSAMDGSFTKQDNADAPSPQD